MQVRPDGPIPAKIMLVGEAPGEEEARLGVPFVGSSGQALDRMLQEAGILRSECFVTNLCRVRPPNNQISAYIAQKKKEVTSQHVQLNGMYVLQPIVEGYHLLQKEIEMVKPNVIIALGNAALWGLTGKWGIQRWRGSMLGGNDRPVIIPTYHPAAILRQWEWRNIAVQDMRRAARFRHTRELIAPPRNFILRPSFEQVIATLTGLIQKLDDGLLEWIDFDIETPIPPKYIECVGISWSKTDAMCIPFAALGASDGYFNLEEEASVVWYLYKLLTHPKVKVRLQNCLFDCIVVHQYWHFIPRVGQDTMVSQHVAWAGLPKKLDFQASMYCDYYVQWKPEKAKEKEGG